MSEEQVNTQPAETNSETNNSTQAEVKNDVPYGRFQEVNQKMRSFESELTKEREANAKLKAQQEDARQESLKKNQEFETLYNETNSQLGKIQEQNKVLSGDLNTFRDGLVNQVPEEKRYITDNMSIANLQKFVQESQVATNAGKTDSSRAGTTAKGEMGGFSTTAEWATKDPAGFTKHLEESVEGYIK